MNRKQSSDLIKITALPFNNDGTTTYAEDTPNMTYDGTTWEFMVSSVEKAQCCCRRQHPLMQASLILAAGTLYSPDVLDLSPGDSRSPAKQCHTTAEVF